MSFCPQDFPINFDHLAANRSALRLARVTAAHIQDVAVRFRHVPQSANVGSRAASLAAIAAENAGHFWPFHDRLMKEEGSLGISSLTALGGSLGLDPERIKAAIDGDTYASRIAEDLLKAEALKVTKLPTVFVNGRRLEGAVSEAAITALVENELAAVRTVMKERRVERGLALRQLLTADHNSASDSPEQARSCEEPSSRPAALGSVRKVGGKG